MLNIAIETDDIRRVLGQIQPRMVVSMKDGFDHASLKFLKFFRLTRLQGPVGDVGVHGDGRSGLYGTFHRKISSDADRVKIFSESNIAELHETGGTVKGQGGDLAVPLSARAEMFTKKGKLKAKYRKPAAIKNLVPIEFAGKVFLTKIERRKNEVLPLYILKSQIDLKPRLEFYGSFETIEDVLFKILGKAAFRGMREAWDRK